jgi:hypothetical protein
MFKLEIATDNAAFEDDIEGELYNILKDTANAVFDGVTSGKIQDSDGNIVGNFKLS